MLTALGIENIVLIEKLSLEFEPGLTALTGETGAGKSIILDSLGMATGSRSDRSLLRQGADKASATAAFFVSNDHPVLDLLKEADIDAAQDLVLRRTLGADGRSRAYINDQPVSVGLLSQVGEALLEVHGQHEGSRLLDPAQHRRLLDEYGALSDENLACAKAWESYQAASKHLKTLQDRRDKADEDREFLEGSMAELDRLNPKSDEEEALAEERKFLQGAEGALADLGQAASALGEDSSWEDQVGQALRGLEHTRRKLGDSDNPAIEALDRAIKSLEQALIETAEARNAITDAADMFEVEPGRLDKIEQRLFALRGAARKHGVSVVDLPELRVKLAEAYADIEQADEKLVAAEKAVETAYQQWDKAALALTKARQAAADKLDMAVAAELPPLKMEKARFKTRLEQLADGRGGAHGRDRVSFDVSTNPGSPFGPLDKIASGGELSRFALAIKVALAEDTGQVLIFDEVDQGVGGAVADAVGRRLSRLSDAAQVLVVTHSPQVAAAADHQFRISKSDQGEAVITHVEILSSGEREEEIARMLAGEFVTEEARAAARQLMAS